VDHPSPLATVVLTETLPWLVTAWLRALAVLSKYNVFDESEQEYLLQNQICTFNVADVAVLVGKVQDIPNLP
jgi:hypothetical protein